MQERDAQWLVDVEANLTKHALERMRDRHIRNSDIDDVLTMGGTSTSGGPSFMWWGSRK